MGLPGLGWRRARLVLVFLLPLAAYLTTLAVAHPVPTGDEPHYLIFATSLAKDHDIDLRNNYADRAQSRAVYPPGGLSPDQQAFTYKTDGPLVSMHGPGLPVLLAPFFALGGTFTDARVLLCLLAAAIGPFLLALLDVLQPRRPNWNLLACLAVMLGVSTLAYAGLVFPEVPGAFLVTITLWVLVAAPPRLGLLAIGSLTAGLLPWLHNRYAILAIPLVLAVLWRAVSTHRPAVGDATSEAALTTVGPTTHGGNGTGQENGGPRHFSKARDWKPAVTAVAWVSILPVVSAIGLGAYQLYAYGSLSPNAPYQLSSQFQNLSFHTGNLYYNTLGSLLSPTVGAIPYSPVLLLAVAGAVVFIHRWRWPGLITVLVAGVYFVFVTDLVGSGAYGPPGRFAVILTPVLAMTLSAILGSGRLIRWLLFPTLVYSLLLSGVAIASFSNVYPQASDKVSLPVAKRLSRMWPDFPFHLHTAFQMTATHALRFTGRVEQTAVDPGGFSVAGPGDRAQSLVFGPYATLQPGTYRADFPIRATDAPPGTEIGRLRVVQAGTVVVDSPVIVQAGSDAAQPVSLYFSTSGEALQTVVFYEGTGRLEVGTIKVAPATPNSAPYLPRAGDGLTLAWIIIIGLLGVLGLSEATESKDASPERLERKRIPAAESVAPEEAIEAQRTHARV